ncbi:MAG: EthD domain-containing protein [Microbacterium sp.]|uniref:EthD domain-containing protein n=1 Tax=Microbacterium sp. TaxID=51671 RepID=UPI00262C9E3D|nr:EthD domain-containing protein [Microbacterium sp.]MCX6503420.1 EthD domain-containing protein [Microbacterium sp.]
MPIFSFLTTKPSTLPEGTRLYELTPRPHASQKHPLPDDLQRAHYLADGPELLPDAELVIPAEGQLMFERPGSGPGRGGVVRLLLNVRKPGISRDQFARHWREVHAPMAIGMNPHYDYYTTNIATDPDSTWDGVLQEWFPSREAFEEHEAGLGNLKKEVSDDYQHFLADSAECPQWIGVEVES